jgi:hypothetical protein
MTGILKQCTVECKNNKNRTNVSGQIDKQKISDSFWQGMVIKRNRISNSKPKHKITLLALCPIELFSITREEIIVSTKFHLNQLVLVRVAMYVG